MNELILQLNEFRELLLTNINVLLPEPHSTLLGGILLGQKADLEPALRQALVATGTIHVIVVSGYNISVVSGWVSSITKYLGARVGLVLTILCVILYVLLTGAEPPTIRAAVMGMIILGARVTGRVNDSYYTLALTAVLMYLFDNTILTSVSFQLSFLATLGILVFSDKLTFKKLPEPFQGDLATTLSAQTLVLPVLIYYFGSLSLIAPLVNVLVLWTIPLSTVLGFLMVVVSLLSLELASIVSWVVWVPLQIFYQVVSMSSGIPFASVTVVKENIYILLGMYLVVLGLWMFIRRRVKNEQTN